MISQKVRARCNPPLLSGESCSLDNMVSKNPRFAIRQPIRLIRRPLWAIIEPSIIITLRADHEEENMAIVILGPGSLGQTFAVLLARHRFPVILVGAPNRVESLLNSGIRLTGLEHEHAPVYPLPDSPKDLTPGQIVASDSLSDAFPVDALIACTKAHQLGSALERMGSVRPGLVLGLQNGVTKDDVLVQRFGPEKVAGAVTIVGADRQDDGSIQITGRGSTFIGPLQNAQGEQLETQARAIIDALNESGYPAEWRPDIVSVEWAKAVVASATFGIAVLTRGTVGDIFSRSSWAACFLDLIEEAAAIADGMGIPLRDLPGFPIQYYRQESRSSLIPKLQESAPALRSVRVSMLQDLLAGRSLEVNEVLGGLLEYADRLTLPVPRLRFTYQVILGFQETVL